MADILRRLGEASAVCLALPLFGSGCRSPAGGAPGADARPAEPAPALPARTLPPSDLASRVEWVETKKPGSMKIEIRYPRLPEQPGFEKLNADLAAKAAVARAGFEDTLKLSPDVSGYGSYTCKLTFLSEALVSGACSSAEHTSQDLGDYFDESFNYVVKGGQIAPLSLPDLFGGESGFQRVLLDHFRGALIDGDASHFLDGSSLPTLESIRGFTIAPRELTLLYSPQDFDRAPRGAFFPVPIPWANLARVLDPAGPLGALAEPIAP